MIIKIVPSPKKYKRFRAIMDNDRVFDFGLDTGSTYIDHKDKLKREAYWDRHYANATEKKLIDNLVPSPSLFSAYLLWGKYFNLKKNMDYLNGLWKDKEETK